jgi:hypothetical protein
MKKNGPQDVCYAVLYDVRDSDYVRSLDPDSLMTLIYQKWNDHPSIFTNIAKADDIVTFPGLSFCMQQILGLTVVRFKFMIAGTDSSQARPYQQSLLGEVTPRIDLTLPGNGSVTRTNQSIRILGNFPASFPTATIKESGLSNASPGGVLLNRNAFPSQPIAHIAGSTAFTLASLITFSAVTTWG